MMQSCALSCRIEKALELGPEILQFHSDNKNIHCREPSLSLCRKSPSTLDIRHHSQIGRLRLAGVIWLSFAWFRFRPNVEVRGGCRLAGRRPSRPPGWAVACKRNRGGQKSALATRRPIYLHSIARLCCGAIMVPPPCIGMPTVPVARSMML